MSTEHGPYSLYEAVNAGRMVVQRQDKDGYKRTVCVVDSFAEWDKFVAALKDGADEVSAVHAIDAQS